MWILYGGADQQFSVCVLCILCMYLLSILLSMCTVEFHQCVFSACVVVYCGVAWKGRELAAQRHLLSPIAQLVSHHHLLVSPIAQLLPVQSSSQHHHPTTALMPLSLVWCPPPNQNYCPRHPNAKTFIIVNNTTAVAIILTDGVQYSWNALNRNQIEKLYALIFSLLTWSALSLRQKPP